MMAKIVMVAEITHIQRNENHLRACHGHRQFAANRSMLMTVLLAIAMSLLCLVPKLSDAHKASDSYLSLAVDSQDHTKINGQWDIALRDLDLVMALDQNGDGVIDWGEVRARHADIAAYATRSLQLKSDNAICPWQVTEHLIDRHTDGAYAVMKLRAVCPSAVDALTVHYSLLFDVDAQHRGLLKLVFPDGKQEEHGQENSEKVETPAADLARDEPASSNTISAVFPADNATQTFADSHISIGSQLATYIADGIKHIAIGFDHILFLVVLLLPAVLVREGVGNDRRWVPVAGMNTAFWNVLKIVTAFTIAHSITLSLAALDVVRLPSRLVESLIAASVLATALDNVWPFLPRKRWLVAFAFGLVHGFGFASVLADLNLPNSSLLLSLLGFNIGVEIGQVALVVVMIPLAYVTRNTKLYPQVALRAGSVVIASISVGWLLERSLNLQLMPF